MQPRRITYQDGLSEPKRETLDIFGNNVSERHYPMHFVGRDATLESLSKSIRYFTQEMVSGPQTRVITGAPGAGKTSLLTRLAEDTRGDPVTSIVVDGAELDTPVAFVEAFMSGISEMPFSMSEAHKSTAEGGLNTVVTAKATTGTDGASATQRLLDGESVWRVIQDLLGVEIEHGYRKNLVLMVDEAQSIDTSKGTNMIVRALQRGESATGSFRILPIFAGLLNLENVLEEVGISRAAFAAERLGVLSRDECAEAIEHLLTSDDMGLATIFSEADRLEITEVLTAASEGWPRHLHCYLSALASQIAADFKKPAPPPKLDLDAVLDAGHLARIEYNKKRIDAAKLSDFVLDALESLAARRRDGQGLTFLEIHESCEHFAGETIDKKELRETEINQAVRAGVLQREIGERVYTFPIPSLRTHIACNGDAKRTLEAMRADLEERLGKLVGDDGGVSDGSRGDKQQFPSV